MSLAVQYELPKMTIGGLSQNIQTVEEEFYAYITAPHSLPGIDTINFWVVSGNVKNLTLFDCY